MDEKLERFKEIMVEVADLDSASALLGWDQQVNMPAAAAEALTCPRGPRLGR